MIIIAQSRSTTPPNMDTSALDFLNIKVPATTTITPFPVKATDITVDPTRDLWFRLFVPSTTTTTASSQSLPIIVYFHGGGFAFGSPASKPFDTFSRRLAAHLPAVVFSVNYRLAPHHRFPTQYDDGLAVLNFIIENSDRNTDWFPPEADRGRLFLAGDSAGGNLAHHVAARWAAGLGGVRINGLVLIQPYFGGEKRTESEVRLWANPTLPMELSDWFWEIFLPVGSGRDHPAANVSGDEVAGLEDYPPTVIVVGGLDPLQDRQRRIGDGLMRAGKAVRVVEYEGVFHGFYAAEPEVAECEMLVSEVREFIGQHNRAS